MKYRQFRTLSILVLLAALFISLGILKLKQDSQKSRLDEKILIQNSFRRQSVDDRMIDYIQNLEAPGESLGLYWLETNYGEQSFAHAENGMNFDKLRDKWSIVNGYQDYIEICSSIWDDVKYFPVAEVVGRKTYDTSYVDSWMTERTYGGNRGHEGTDIMASENRSGIYPIISMTDGVIENKGWLEKGGYRLGIKAPGGAYFYYAHLASYANLEIGDTVKAGDFLGYMGDTGYGPEGTTGQFPVHLHVGIYIYPGEQETSVNPYSVLKYIENRKVKCVY